MKMEVLKRKMEGLSRGMLVRIDECSHLLSSKGTSSQDIVSYNEAEHMPFLHLRQQLLQEKPVRIQTISSAFKQTECALDLLSNYMSSM